ncbi:MAG: hypothetical protein KJ583_02240 [Nanoarchaeota archaeon]|nr:hypothetical protein [Nanoarchaeota archaeon]MBU1269521.1 hypothetical protein [Nanoarchaeota archaeon]MBU1604114.1 hypothetical protein [Nanoarchaeota archaeon]MBU2442816.1 hypothetical protein [Nanoarchaeota archaeon]
MTINSNERRNSLDGEDIVKIARKSIGKFCIEECKAYCCRKGYLILKENQLDLVMQGRKEELDCILKPLKDDTFSMFMGNHNQSCPSLTTSYTCQIHKKRNRPQACKDFPVFLTSNKIILSPRCLAVKGFIHLMCCHQFVSILD